MAVFYEQDVRVNRSSEQLRSQLSATTINPSNIWSYGKIGIFRGTIKSNSFKLELNTPRSNSFAWEANGTIQAVDDNQCAVNLKFGMRTFGLVFFLLCNLPLLIPILYLPIQAILGRYSGDYATLLLMELLLIAIEFSLLYFGLFYNYKKLKTKILDFLSHK